MRNEKEHKEQVEKTRNIIKEAYECVISQIGLGDHDLPVSLDFRFRMDGIAVDINIFEYDI